VLRSVPFQNVPFTVRLAVGLWVALVAGVTVRVAKSHPYRQSVVPIYRSAGEHFLEGRPLYCANPPHDVFRYPPPAAAGFCWLALLDEHVGAIVWRLIGILAFATGLRRFQRAFEPEMSLPSRGLLWACAAPLILPSFNNGQGNVLVAAASLHAAAGLPRAAPLLSAAWLALAAGLKLYPLAPAALFVIAAPWRLLPRLVVAVALVFASPFLLQDSDYVVARYAEFVQYCGTDDRQATILDRAPRDWTVVPRAWEDIVISARITLAVSAAAGLACALAVLIAHRRGTAVETAFVLGLTWMTVFGPATENPTYSLLAAPAAWAVSVARKPYLAGFVFVLLLLPVLRGLFPTSEVWPLRTVQPCAALLLMIEASMRLLRVSAPAPTARTNG
jgi:hypothetical protein